MHGGISKRKLRVKQISENECILGIEKVILVLATIYVCYIFRSLNCNIITSYYVIYLDQLQYNCI